jgi:hypothetical protein
VFRESFWTVNAAGRSQPCEIAFDHLIIICKLYVHDIHSFFLFLVSIICKLYVDVQERKATSTVLNIRATTGR